MALLDTGVVATGGGAGGLGGVRYNSQAVPRYDPLGAAAGNFGGAQYNSDPYNQPGGGISNGQGGVNTGVQGVNVPQYVAQQAQSGLSGGNAANGPGGYANMNSNVTGQYPNSPYPSNYGQQLQGDIQQSANYGIQQQVQGYYAPDIAQYGINNTNYQNQLALSGANYANQRQYMQGQYGIDTQKNGLQQQGIGMDQAYYQGLIPEHQQIMDINNQQSGNYGAMNTNLSSEQQNIGTMQRNITGMSGNLDQQLNNTLAHLQTQADTAQRGIGNQFTAGGNFFSPEHGAQVKDVNTNLGQGQTGARLGTAYQQLGLQNQNLDLGNNSLQLGNEKLRNINNILSNDQANITQHMSIEDLQNKIGHSGIDLQSLGLDRQGLDLKLNNGLNQLGLSQSMDANKIYSMMASNNVQLQQLGRAMITQALQMGYKG